MFRIRCVYDDLTPADKEAINQVQQILRNQFPGLASRDINKLPKQLHNPMKYRFRVRCGEGRNEVRIAAL